LPNPVLTRAIDRLASREDLPADDMSAVLAEIMAGNASETETAAVLIALRTKGETVEELVGLATTMRLLATPVTTGRDDLIDTAGTGGGVVMAVEHREIPAYGVQFHPESVLTPEGKRLLENFLAQPGPH